MNPSDDQERIRLKRLEKLGGAPSSSSTPPAAAPKPPAKAPGKLTEKPKQPPTVISTPVKTPPSKPLPKVVPFLQWENSTLESILGVTLNSTKAGPLLHLHKVAEELLFEDSSLVLPIAITSDIVDRLLLSRLSLLDDIEYSTENLPGPFDYLASCWVQERSERIRVMSLPDESKYEKGKRISTLDTVKDLLVSYIGIVLLNPEVFPSPPTSPPTNEQLSSLLLPGSENSPSKLHPSTVPVLLQDLAARYAPSDDISIEESIVPILDATLSVLSQLLLRPGVQIGTGYIPKQFLPQSTGNPGSEVFSYSDVLFAYQQVVNVKVLANLSTQGGSFDPLEAFRTNNVVVGHDLPRIAEARSLLGPIMRLSAFPDTFPHLSESYFPNVPERAFEDPNVKSAWDSLRMTMGNVQNAQFNIVNAIVRGSPAARERFLQYVANIAQVNSKRAGMRVDPLSVSSEGFMMNVHSTLLDFAGPFLDSSFSKIDKIDPSYYKTSKRIDISQETKMSATKEESDEYYNDGTATTPAHFISEIFFLTCQFFHLGTMHAIKEHKTYTDQIRYLRRDLAEMESDTSFQGTPHEAGMRTQINRYKKKLEICSSRLCGLEVQLLDPKYLSKCIDFANLLMAWLVRLVDPKGKHPWEQIQFPLPEETPILFRMLPEYLIEDVTSMLSFVSKYAPGALAKSSTDDLLVFMLVFLASPYMKNPYLKGQFVEIMYYLGNTKPGYQRGPLADALSAHPLALKNLMPCLINAYIQIEITGSHTQFYDKFMTRYYITQLMKQIWDVPAHKEALQKASRNIDVYVRFVNLLMNDTTYLLDDAISTLHKIADLLHEMKDQTGWQALPQTDRQEKEKLLKQYEGQVKNDLDFGTESLFLLKTLCKITKAPFLTPEIVDRLAAMLDINLELLAGPRRTSLKVADPEKYKFNPRALLSDLLQVYLELGPHAEFRIGVSKDGRSYSKSLFMEAINLGRKLAIKTDEELVVIQEMIDAVEILRAEEEEDEALGEVPDEFLDPLTYDIMRNPVILPSSKIVVDESTIKQHYLSDATDPFNRIPFKWEDLVPNTELKQQIEEFKAKRKAERSHEAMDVDS